MLLREERMTKKYVQIIISRRNSSDYLPIVHMCSLYGFYSQKFLFRNVLYKWVPKEKKCKLEKMCPRAFSFLQDGKPFMSGLINYLKSRDQSGVAYKVESRPWEN